MIVTQDKTTTLYSYQNGIGANTEAILNRTLRHILYGDLYDGGGSGFGEWQLVSYEHDQVSSLFNYFGAKGNGITTYNSVATFNVSDALVQAMVSDQGYREWEAVIQAVNELTGTTDWFFDTANSRVTYRSRPSDGSGLANAYDPYFYVNDSHAESGYRTPEISCEATAAFTRSSANADYLAYIFSNVSSDYPANEVYGCQGSAYNKSSGENYGAYSWSVYKKTNPNYNPNLELPEAYITFIEIAQKIISNAASSVEITELMASTFIQAVMGSALNPDEAQQIIKYVDILEQLEENKWQLV